MARVNKRDQDLVLILRPDERRIGPYTRTSETQPAYMKPHGRLRGKKFRGDAVHANLGKVRGKKGARTPKKGRVPFDVDAEFRPARGPRIGK